MKVLALLAITISTVLINGCGLVAEAYVASSNYEDDFQKRFNEYEDKDDRVKFYGALARSSVIRVSITEDKVVKISKTYDYQRVRESHPEIYKYLNERDAIKQEILFLNECKFFDNQNWNCTEQGQNDAYVMIKNELFVRGIRYEKTYKLNF